MERKTVYIIGIVAILLLALLANLNSGDTKDSIKVGAILPLTGPGSFLGEQARDGIILAQGEINGAGGVNGRQMDVVFEDSKADPKEAISIFNNMMINGGPNVVITAFSGPSLALAPLAEQNGIPLITTITSAPGIAEQGNYVFRVFTTSSFDAPVSANSLIGEGFERYAVLAINDDYGNSYAEEFSKTVEDKGGEIVASESFVRDDIDFKTQLLKIKNKNPEVIYVVGYDGHYISIFKQIRELGLTQKLAGNWILASPNSVSVMEGNSEGALITTPLYYLSQDNEQIMSFNDEFKTLFGKEADAYAAFGYDTLNLIAEGIELEGSERKEIKEGLLNIKYEGLMGSLSFDSQGEINFDLFSAEIKNGKISLL